ncbi:serine protease inhibitor 42Dd isoform X2 [Drosophila willistoni]|uniref:serine protease inhibitor 42Dd isoform X2 n=1 Tax=Drosophila willistoni TaxID=7260 RepID=UPI000C26D684|nr:serine protease inhibitor 42Dd isoform X2 [Drosophila willistoni]
MDNTSRKVAYTPPPGDFSGDLEKFSNYLYNQLSTGNPNRNIIFSPFCIQTCAAMLLMGAEKGTETFGELRYGLQFSSENCEDIASEFDTILTAYQQLNTLKTANKLYLMKGLSIQRKFENLLTQKFHSRPESLDFANSLESAEHINDWVESRTNKLIKGIIKPDSLNSQTRLILVNAIHFKGEWEIKFNEKNTLEDDFYINESQRITVQMMHLENTFLYAELKDLDATALQMDYKDSDLSMLIVLPNTRTGLRHVENKLQSTSLKKITNLLTETPVDVKIPKFKAEFEQELSPVFQVLGIKRIFSNDAELGKIITTDDPVNVSQILHKAYIEVNELGSEAAAATDVIKEGSSHIKITFEANRPFFYGIFNGNGIRFLEGIFIGK